ncbi:hypothetical protein BH09VER1_BH09VER1_06990 [soil metagenome]
MNSRVFKAKTPIGVIVSAVLIAGAVVAFIVFATWQTTVGVVDSKKTGTIVKKEFVAAPEKQIIVDRKGNLTTETKDGEYILRVEVPERNGPTKTYTVWMPDKASYDALKVGDSYDIGPILIPEKK